MAHRPDRAKEREIALVRIAELFNQAKLRFKEYPQLSHRYVFLARKIAMKCKVSIPSVYKRQFCKKCYHFLVPGVNCRVRLTKKKNVVYYCRECKQYNKVGYGKARSEKHH